MQVHSYLRSSNFKILVATVVLLIASGARAQNSEPLPYLNPALSAEQRAADLVHRMTKVMLYRHRSLLLWMDDRGSRLSFPPGGYGWHDIPIVLFG